MRSKLTTANRKQAVVNLLQIFAISLAAMLGGTSIAQECENESPKENLTCFGFKANHPEYYGEWQGSSATGVGIIKYSDDKIYIGGVVNGAPEKRGVMLQGWNFGYGLWSSGWLARTEEMSNSFIYEQLSYIGNNLNPQKSPAQIIEALRIKPSIFPKFALLDASSSPSIAVTAQSSDDVECTKFGFQSGTPDYSRCLQALTQARAEAKQRQAEYELELKRYETEKRAYEQKLAQYEEQKKQAEKQKLIKFGLALMGGTSPSFTENLNNANRAILDLPPQPPSQPVTRNFTIINPKGGITNCNIFGSVVQCR